MGSTTSTYPNDLSKSYQNVTEKIKEIHTRREQHIASTKGHFNVFNILNIETKENYHSRFILDLLNPKGSHSCGQLFLDHFIDILRDSLSISLKTEDISLIQNDKFIRARTEEPTDKNRRIDIYLEFKEFILAIENKIWAGEQPDQISDYSQYLQKTKQKSILLFLTLEGKDSNTANGCVYYPISYREHIFNWLDLCLKSSYKYININQTIQQYLKVITQLTNQTLESEDMDEIKAFLKINSNVILYQQEINLAIVELREEIKQTFMKKLFGTLSDKNILKTGEDHTGKSVIYNYRYGLCLKGYEHIEFTLEEDTSQQSIYIGLRILKYDGRNQDPRHQNNLEELNALRNELDKEFSCLTNKYWPAGYYMLNLGDFFSPSYLVLLTDPSSFEIEVGKIVDKIIKFINEMTPLINSIIPR